MIDEADEDRPARPALAPRQMCDLPEGRKLLPRHWYEGDIVPGSTLRSREESRIGRERAAKTRKHGTWDEKRQEYQRGLARYEFTFDAEGLWTPSTARH